MRRTFAKCYCLQLIVFSISEWRRAGTNDAITKASRLQRLCALESESWKFGWILE
jgi:hypothetical protein